MDQRALRERAGLSTGLPLTSTDNGWMPHHFFLSRRIFPAFRGERDMSRKMLFAAGRDKARGHKKEGRRRRRDFPTVF
jgi:hypothetical protein